PGSPSLAGSTHRHPHPNRAVWAVLASLSRRTSIGWLYPFHTRTALEQLAAGYSANYYTNGGSIDLISRRHISEKVFRLVLQPRCARCSTVFTAASLYKPKISLLLCVKQR